MKSLVVYDTVNGNTEAVAKTIGTSLPGEVEVCKVGSVGAAKLPAADLLVIGSPTFGGKPTPAIAGFVGAIPDSSMKAMRVAAFDTRVAAKFAKIFGYAAPKIAGLVAKRGGAVQTSPEGFIVKTAKGPLAEGELGRAAAWAKLIAKG